MNLRPYPRWILSGLLVSLVVGVLAWLGGWDTAAGSRDVRDELATSAPDAGHAPDPTPARLSEAEDMREDGRRALPRHATARESDRRFELRVLNVDGTPAASGVVLAVPRPRNDATHWHPGPRRNWPELARVRDGRLTCELAWFADADPWIAVDGHALHPIRADSVAAGEFELRLAAGADLDIELDRAAPADCLALRATSSGAEAKSSTHWDLESERVVHVEGLPLGAFGVELARRGAGGEPFDSAAVTLREREVARLALRLPVEADPDRTASVDGMLWIEPADASPSLVDELVVSLHAFDLRGERAPRAAQFIRRAELHASSSTPTLFEFRSRPLPFGTYRAEIRSIGYAKEFEVREGSGRVELVVPPLAHARLEFAAPPDASTALDRVRALRVDPAVVGAAYADVARRAGADAIELVAVPGAIAVWPNLPQFQPRSRTFELVAGHQSLRYELARAYRVTIEAEYSGRCVDLPSSAWSGVRVLPLASADAVVDTGYASSVPGHVRSLKLAFDRPGRFGVSLPPELGASVRELWFEVGADAPQRVVIALAAQPAPPPSDSRGLRARTRRTPAAGR